MQSHDVWASHDQRHTASIIVGFHGRSYEGNDSRESIRVTNLPRDTNSLPHGLSLTRCAKHLGLSASLLETGPQSIGAIPQAT